VTEVVFVRFGAPLQWKSKFYRTDDNYRIFTQMKSKLNYSQPEYFEKAGNYPTKYNIYHDQSTGKIYIT
jgi:hypothetical protein